MLTTLSKVVSMSFVGDHEESRSGDGDPAFRDYVLARGTALLRMAVMLTGNRADAEDLVQASLAKTYLAWGKINDRAALDAYVRRGDSQYPYIVVAPPAARGIPCRRAAGPGRGRPCAGKRHGRGRPTRA